MTVKTKINILSRVIFYVIFIIIYILLDIDFNDFPNAIFKAFLCGVLTWTLSPKINSVKTQSGDKMELKWFFSKKTISI